MLRVGKPWKTSKVNLFSPSMDQNILQPQAKRLDNEVTIIELIQYLPRPNGTQIKREVEKFSQP